MFVPSASPIFGVDISDDNGNANDNSAFDTTTSSIWDRINKGVRAADWNFVKSTKLADRQFQRQWKDIKSRYIQAAEEQAEEDEEDE